MDSELVALLRHPDPARLELVLAEDVRFHSPVADYRGREDVAHLFTTIARVLESLEPVRELTAGRERATFVSGAVRGRTVEGVLDEHRDPAGRVVEVTLMLRPLSVLRVAVGEMAAALEADPLPSRVGRRERSA
jgi:hypothetical protein